MGREEHLYLLPDVITWVKPECCVYLNFSLTIPLLWIRLFTVVIFMHFCLFIYCCIQVMWFVYGLFLKIEFDCKSSNLSVANIRTGNFILIPLWVIFFRFRGGWSGRSTTGLDSRLPGFVWYLTRDVYLCFCCIYIFSMSWTMSYLYVIPFCLLWHTWLLYLIGFVYCACMCLFGGWV